jgi:serine/threonine protein phosphatase PrpC
MTDDEILKFLIREKPGPEMLDKMVDVVNDRGGPDNVTMTITAVENTL